MKRLMWAGALIFFAAYGTHAAEEKFSRVVSAADFAAAGLAKLSPEELARLDALVCDYQSGALAEAQRALEVARAKAAQAEAAARAADASAAAAKVRAEAADKKAGAGLLERENVLLKPGTKVEYSTLESRLVGNFVGWEKNTVFHLENGQRWRVVDGSSYVTPPVPAMKVKIVPGVLGTFWMKFEGVGKRAKVEAL